MLYLMILRFCGQFLLAKLINFIFAYIVILIYLPLFPTHINSRVDTFLSLPVAGAGCRMPVPVAGCRMPYAGCWPVPDAGGRMPVPDASGRMPDAGGRMPMPDAGCRLPACARGRMRMAGCRMPDAACRCVSVTGAAWPVLVKLPAVE